MASLSDILTAAKNIVTALNDLGQAYLSVEGSSLSLPITSSTLVQKGQGRVARVYVTTAGSAAGAIYDAATAGATTGIVYTIPNTVGIYEVKAPVINGIVVSPGTGQSVTISYS